MFVRVFFTVRDPKSQLPTQHLALSGHVLVAEDNRINQMYISELLKHLGCTCDLLVDGEDALAAVERQRYDLMPMDCQMPEMDGFTASREIRRREAANKQALHLPIVALTANVIQGDRDRCLDASMDEYVSKPVEAERLRRVLERFLGRAYFGRQCERSVHLTATN